MLTIENQKNQLKTIINWKMILKIKFYLYKKAIFFVFFKNNIYYLIFLYNSYTSYYYFVII